MRNVMVFNVLLISLKKSLYYLEIMDLFVFLRFQFDKK